MYPARDPSVVNSMPFLQEDLYSAPQPGTAHRRGGVVLSQQKAHLLRSLFTLHLVSSFYLPSTLSYIIAHVILIPPPNQRKMTSITYYSIKNWPSDTQFTQTHQLRIGWVQLCQASVSAVLSAFPPSSWFMFSYGCPCSSHHVSVQKRKKKKSGGHCNDSQVSPFYWVKQKLSLKPPAAREPCQSSRSRGWEHLWGEPQSGVYNSRLQSRAKALSCASWSQGQGCFHMTSTTRQSLCAVVVVGTVTRDWAAETVVSEVSCPSLGASPLSHYKILEWHQEPHGPWPPRRHLKSLPGTHGHTGEILASVLEKAATHLFILRLRLGLQPPLGFSVVWLSQNPEMRARERLVSWARGCERPWRRQRRVRLMVCWREEHLRRPIPP